MGQAPEESSSPFATLRVDQGLISFLRWCLSLRACFFGRVEEREGEEFPVVGKEWAKHGGGSNNDDEIELNSDGKVRILK